MNAVVFGASGGIGDALVRELLLRANYETVFSVSRSAHEVPGSVNILANALDENDLEKAASRIHRQGPLNLCIVSIGVLSDGHSLQPERSFRQQSLENFERVFRTNTFGPALVAKHILPYMPRRRPAIFAILSARVGSIADNRLGGWHCYRASKSALNMLIKNFAIEQARRNKDFVVVGLHPGTVETALSKPFQKNVKKERLFSPSQSASFMLDVIDGLTPGDSGRVFDWAGNEVPA